MVGLEAAEVVAAAALVVLAAVAAVAAVQVEAGKVNKFAKRSFEVNSNDLFALRVLYYPQIPGFADEVIN